MGVILGASRPDDGDREHDNRKTDTTHGRSSSAGVAFEHTPSHARPRRLSMG
jgi:hypothetical protein